MLLILIQGPRHYAQTVNVSRKSREAWGEFHERTFRMFGGIFSKVIYDNDTVLITDVEEKMPREFSVYLIAL